MNQIILYCFVLFLAYKKKIIQCVALFKKQIIHSAAIMIAMPKKMTMQYYIDEL